MKALRLLIPLVLCSACVDPAGRLDEFYENSEPFRIVVTSGECIERIDISGDYFLALATVVNPSAPILFAATFDIDPSVEPWAVTVTMKPLAIEGRTEVGEALVASGTIKEDGTFELDFGSVTILGSANPVVPGVDATATLLLSGCTNSAAFSCGNIDGAITSPADLPLTGSTYAAFVVDGDEILTAVPVSACPAE